VTPSPISKEAWLHAAVDLLGQPPPLLPPLTVASSPHAGDTVSSPCDSLNVPFSLEEVVKGVDALCNNKAAGLDGITAELIKDGIEVLANPLCTLVQYYLMVDILLHLVRE
jgi:hypothetical protein